MIFSNKGQFKALLTKELKEAFRDKPAIMMTHTVAEECK